MTVRLSENIQYIKTTAVTIREKMAHVGISAYLPIATFFFFFFLVCAIVYRLAKQQDNRVTGPPTRLTSKCFFRFDVDVFDVDSRLTLGKHRLHCTMMFFP